MVSLLQSSGNVCIESWENVAASCTPMVLHPISQALQLTCESTDDVGFANRNWVTTKKDAEQKKIINMRTEVCQTIQSYARNESKRNKKGTRPTAWSGWDFGVKGNFSDPISDPLFGMMHAQGVTTKRQSFVGKSPKTWYARRDDAERTIMNMLQKDGPVAVAVATDDKYVQFSSYTYSPSSENIMFCAKAT